MFLALTLLACDMTPTYVDGAAVERAAVTANWKTVCKGLEMKEDNVRQLAARKLVDSPDPMATTCLCAEAVDAATGDPDLAILAGLKGSKRAEMVSCFYPALDKAGAGGDRRTDFIGALLATELPEVKGKLRAVAENTAEKPEVRARATEGMRGTTDAEVNAALRKLLTDPEAQVRAAAAKALSNQRDPDSLAALSTAATTDAEAKVRAAALTTLTNMKDQKEGEAMACKAMMEDPDPVVRQAAVMSFQGTKSETGLACLRKKAMTKEESPEVRLAVVNVIKSSPSQAAADTLCEIIPFWMKTYVTDKSPQEIPDLDLAKYQNERDWKNSYACFGKVLGQSGGWSCKAKQYVAWWYREVGGTTHVAACPGDTPQ